MVDLSKINDNIIANRWKERYATLSDEKKDKLKKLDDLDMNDYQLRVIKRKRIYPLIGDIFMIKPKDDIDLYGVVINNHIDNINGKDLLLVLILKKGINLKECIAKGVTKEDLLIPPEMVGKEYWSRGYFYNVDHYDEKINVNNYGFYSIGKGKFFDEHGKELTEEPPILGLYGVATIIGIAGKINRELIIAGIL